MARLENKVALVVGASAGIGRETAKLFAAEGAKVVLGSRREGELVSLAEEMLKTVRSPHISAHTPP